MSEQQPVRAKTPGKGMAVAGGLLLAWFFVGAVVGGGDVNAPLLLVGLLGAGLLVAGLAVRALRS